MTEAETKTFPDAKVIQDKLDACSLTNDPYNIEKGLNKKIAAQFAGKTLNRHGVKGGAISTVALWAGENGLPPFMCGIMGLNYETALWEKV